MKHSVATAVHKLTMIQTGEGVDYGKNLEIETLDYGTFHLYPTSCEFAPFRSMVL